MSSTKAAKLRTKDGHSRLQSLTKTSNFVFRDDVTKDEQGLDARILFTRSDYFASENAKQCKKKKCVKKYSTYQQPGSVAALSGSGKYKKMTGSGCRFLRSSKIMSKNSQG